MGDLGAGPVSAQLKPGGSAMTTMITARAALVGSRLEHLAPACLVIEGAHIATLGSPAEVRARPDRHIEVPELTLVPGFIDCHVHAGFYPPGEILGGGVTTARDLGWPPELIFPLVESSRREGFEGPTLVAAGPILTAPGGYPSAAAWAPPGTARLIRGPGEAGPAVERTLAEGATIIKIALNPSAGPSFDESTLRALVDAAHARGARVTGHIDGVAELINALDAGVDELAHMLLGGAAIPDRLIARMVAAGTTVVPTLSIHRGRDRAAAVDNLRRFAAAGGSFVYGTDLGNEGPSPGIDALEVAAMDAAGIPARRIIESATVAAAAYLGLATTGILEVGMDADIVGLEGDPAHDHSALTAVGAVWRRGRRVLTASERAPR